MSEENPKGPKLLDRVRGKIRLLHHSRRMEEAYVQWIIRYIHFHKKKHPNTLGAAHIEGFLTDLAQSGEHAKSDHCQPAPWAGLGALARWADRQ